MRHRPVFWLQNWPPPQPTVAQLSAMHDPPTQRSLLLHLFWVHRSTQAPSAQYWLPAQVTPLHWSTWQLPAMQSWPAAQPSVLQSTQRPCWQILGSRQTTPAQTSTQVPVASSQRLVGRAGHAGAALRDAEVVRRTCSRRGRGTRPARHWSAQLPVLAAEARRTDRRSVSVMPSQSLSLPSQISAAGQHAALADEAARAAADEVAGLAGAAGRVDLRLGRGRGRGRSAGLGEGAVVDDAVAVVVDAVADLGCRHAGRVADELAVRAHDGPPTWQVPRPLPQVSPTPGSVPSSILPLQLSSMPLQTSGLRRHRGRVAERAAAVGLAGQDAAAPAGADAVVATAGGARPVEALVDVAVAVVVEAVADLGRRSAQPQGCRRRSGGSPRRPCRCSCRRCSCRSRPRSAGRPCPCRLSGSVGLLGLATAHMFD